MRQRVTYLLPRGRGVDPADIRVHHSSLEFARAHEAAAERRVTLGLGELPDELRVFLHAFHELHIRVASSRNHRIFSPAFARLPPGLHAFFTPTRADQDPGLCAMLRHLFGQGISCADSKHSFSRPPVLSGRFASSSTYQFYTPSYALAAGGQRLLSPLCSDTKQPSAIGTVCASLHEATTTLAHFDLDFDAISHAVVLTFLCTPRGHHSGTVASVLRKSDAADRLEVGILSPEEPTEPEDLSLGGFLTVVGEDDHPSATLFSFPARHHSLPADDETTYSVRFQQPTGLHPKLDITFSRPSPTPPKDSCALHAYWTVPSSLFIDRYQLSDPLFLQSQNLVAVRALSGEQDLEAPDWAVHGWGSAALFELGIPDNDQLPDGWTVTVPTHLRYLSAAASSSGHADTSVPWPVVFWACAAEDGLKMSTNPFDRVNLGYDGLFGPKTMFYHVPPSPGAAELREILKVPVLDPQSARWVPSGTLVAVILGFGWICWQMLKNATASEDHEGKKQA